MKPLRIALAAIVLAAAPVFAGPPWISIEYPANPFDAATKDALMVVHTYHHGIPMQFPLRAWAEGNVNGARKKIPLQIVATSKTGVWAVKGDLPKTGTWVVRTDMTDTETNYTASALVRITDNELVRVKIPARAFSGGKTPIVATQQDVEELLAAR